MSLNIDYYFQHPEAFPFPDFFEDITLTWEVLAKIRPFLERRLVESGIKEMRGELKGGDLHCYGNYFIDEGTIIYNGVTIMGPVYIGKNCEILPGAVIRPYTVMGDNCSCGHGSELKRCLMFAGSKVASLAFAGDSVLGASARIGSGVVTANRKYDQTSATLKLDGVKHDLGDAFFGCILGDSSRLGANCVTQPGTHVGPYTWAYPMTALRGFIPREKRVYHERTTVMEDNGIHELKP